MTHFAVTGGAEERRSPDAIGERDGRGGSGGVRQGIATGPDLPRDARILIVDDWTLYRECLAASFAADGRVPPSVAWDLWSLIAALEEFAPNVVLLNIQTHDSGMLLRQVAEISPTARVIVFGLSEDDETEIVACAELGVAGYHLQTESLENLPQNFTVARVRP